MQVGVDVKCMHTNFDGHSLFGFGDITTFQIWPNFPSGHGIVHFSEKIESNRIGSINSCK